MKKAAILFIGFLLIGFNVSAQDISIDGSGNLTTGTSNSYGNLKVTGASGEHAVAGEASGTGAAGVYGQTADSNNKGALGGETYGVYGYSLSGNAGFFDGNTTVNGDLTVSGSLLSNHNHDTDYVNEGQAGSVTSSMIVDGTIQQGDLSFALGDGHSLDAADGSPTDAVYVDNTGNVGVGTTTPAGKLDVSGDICLGSVCRTTWPSGSGTGAFTDTGSLAYYTGGNVGIGTSSPSVIGSATGRGLHIMKTSASGDVAAGVRLEIDSLVNGGIAATYNGTSGVGGMFVGSMSNHRVGIGTNGTEKVTVLPNGNLGIGTIDPQQPLHVQGNAYINDNIGLGVLSPTHKLQVSGSSSMLSSGAGDFKLYLSKNAESDMASVQFQQNYTSYAEVGLTADNNFHIKVSPDGTTLTDALTIERATGNIGMGIMVPEAKLNVMASDIVALWTESLGIFPSFVAKKFNDGDNAYIIKYDGTGRGLVVDQRGTGHALAVQNNTTPILAAESTGNIGIGTTTPSAKMDINGATGYNQLRLRTSYTPTGSADTNGNTGDVTWDDNYMYIKTSGGWKRAALSTF